MEMTDKQFAIQFSYVLAALIAIAFLCYFGANILAPDYQEQHANTAKITARIEPVGKVNTSEMAQEPAQQATAATTVAESTSAAAADGGQVYASVCAACHDNGIANAPKMGDKAAWADRLAAGVDALYNSSLNGKGVMPPKGGRPDLPDDDIKAAVDHMLSSVQ